MSGDYAPDWFPDLIISEILTRLPAKCVGRFKCVSKRWLSLISSPHSFLPSSLIPHLHGPSWIGSSGSIRVVPGLDGGHGQTLNLSLVEPPSVSFLSITPLVPDPPDYGRRSFPTVINGGDGLLLFAVSRKRDPYKEHQEHQRDPKSFSHRTEEDSLFVCKPVTRQWFQLPKPP